MEHLHPQSQETQTTEKTQDILSKFVDAFNTISINLPQTFQPKPISISFKLESPVVYLHYLLVLVAMVVWILSLTLIDLSQINDLGLVSVLNPMSYFVLACLTISYIVALQDSKVRVPLMALHIIGLIFILYGVSPIVEAMPNFSVNWRHVGIIQYITDNGLVDPNIDAYFNWPSFFIAGSTLTEITGIESSLSFVPWSAFYFNLLYFLPLYQIIKVALDNKRATWLGVWLFYVCNWIGQDYFSPQALNYFFYLVIIAVLLTWFKKSGFSLKVFGPSGGLISRTIRMINRLFTLPSNTITQKSATPTQKIGLLLILIIIFAASAMSHQLTPFAILFSVTVLVFFNYISPRNLPIIMGIILATWISYMAVAYMQGHIEKIISEIGQMGSSLDENVTGRMSGSAEHQVITSIRTYMSLAIWSLAGLGGLWRLYKKQHVVIWGLLAAITFALIGLQDYGGEMILRVYLLSLPFMLVFIVSLFFPTPIFRYKWLSALVLSVMTIIIAMGFLFSRYGNQRMDYKTVAEIDGIRTLYDFAEPGSLLLAVRPNLAWKFEGYDTYRYQLIGDEFEEGDINGIVDRMKEWDAPSYLVLTRSQQVSAEMFLGFTQSDWENFETGLTTGGLSAIFDNGDTTIYALNERALRNEIIAEQPELDIWATRHNPLFSIALLIFLLVVPGKAIVRRLKLDDSVTEWMLSIALSISLLIIISTALISIHIWQTEFIFYIMAGITYIAVFFPSWDTLNKYIVKYQELQNSSLT